MLTPFIFTLHAMANHKPLWEVGLGFGMYHYPHYLGANQSSTYALPVPYLIYRGDHFRSDRSGVTGLFYDHNRWHLRLSLGGALPINSKDNEAREGMPDKGFLLEVGPGIQYDFVSEGNKRIYLDLPFRAAYGFGDSSGHHGSTVAPRLVYKDVIDNWQFSYSTGLVFGTNDYHAYIYDVKPRYAKPGRQAYQSSSGYTGFRYSMAASRRVGDVMFAGYFSYYNLHRAANIESPLMKVDSYAAGGFAIIWILGQSSERVSKHYQE